MEDHLELTCFAKKEGFCCASNYGLDLGMEFWVDPFCFGSFIQLGCVPPNKLFIESEIT